MSLVNALLNGGAVGAAEVDVTRYGHSSAPRIAMESAAELHEIFMESFYNVEQAELAAATEGVALEGSQYEVVAENAIKNGISKIREFLEKLWGKVKAFFHNIKRYLDSIFMSGTEFVKKYKNDIKDMGKLEDYTVTMYKYDDHEIDNVEGVLVDNVTNKILRDFGIDPENAAEYAVRDAERMKNSDKYLKNEEKEFEEETFRKYAVSLVSGGKCKDPDDYDKWVFKNFRNGAEGPDDKEEIDVTSVNQYITELERADKLSEYVTKAQKDTDKAFSNAVKVVKKCESALDKVKDSTSASNMSKVMRIYSRSISIVQSYSNTYYNGWKAVIKERDTVYKQVIMGAFSNAKKTAKKDK